MTLRLSRRRVVRDPANRLTPHRSSGYPRGQDRKENPKMKNSAGNRLRSSARFSLMALVGLALAGGAAAVRGQSALDGFDPNANGEVHVAVVQPDGKILIGGFSSIGAHVRRNIVRLFTPDGTPDAFDPNANGTVDSIAVQADGKILAGGDFSGPNSIGGQTRNY